MPQKSPGSLRSSRNRALEIGTSGPGFPENAAGPYDAPAGVPATHSGGTYRDNTAGVPDPGAPVTPATPFKLGQ